MLSQSYLIAFNDTKSKNFSNALKDSSIYIINCVSQPIAQDLDKIHVYMGSSFVDLLQESKSLLDFNWTCVGVNQKRVNIKSAITMTTTMTPCSGAILAGNSILQIMHWKYRDFRNAFARKFYEQMVVSFQVETCKFTKNKLLKLVNSMKWVSLFAGSNLNSIVVKKKFQNAAF